MSINKSKAEKIIKEAFGKEVYKNSLQLVDNTWLAITKSTKGNKKLVCVQLGASELFAALEAQVDKYIDNICCKLCALNASNAKIIRRYVTWAAPSPAGREQTLLGTGDRLGIATPAHILVAAKTKVRPALAQASAKTIATSGFSYTHILDNATWGVLQSGWQDGWSANAEQLSNEQDINSVLAEGYTGITLDCSTKLQNLDAVDNSSLQELYSNLPAAWRSELETVYLDQVFEIQEYGAVRLPLCASGGSMRYKAGKFRISYSLEQLQRLAVTYSEVIRFVVQIYRQSIQAANLQPDFAAALNNGVLVTTPQAHVFIANELSRYGVQLSGFAPRFVGEFPAGIDYVGDKWEFEQTFSIHAAIADHYGHRLEFAYSDKYLLYPFIGRDTRGRVALKTEGTSWLEALHTIWKANPALFRDILDFARKYFADNQGQLTLTTDNPIQAASHYSDKELEKLLVCNDDCRQMLHLACAALLRESKLREAIYSCLYANEELHYKVVAENLKKHIEYLRTIKRSLGLPKNRFFRTE